MLGVLLGLAATPGAPALKDPPPMIVGTWVVESIQTTGKPVKPGAPLSYQFTADSTWRRLCAGRQCGSVHSYRLDSSKSPVAIDLIEADGDKQKEARAGIVQVEGDTVRLCVVGRPGPRPAEFQAGPASPNVIYVLKRWKPKE